jgi:8-amino-7-oxononanoate synthase
MRSLDAFAGEKLAALEAKSLRRRLSPTRRHDGAVVERDGKRLISFSCNDYLNLSQHPLVRAAAAEAALNYGAGAAASRLVTGDHPLLSDLEKRLARLKGTEAACVFGSGYLANAGVIPTLVGPGDLVLIDALAHACIWAGAQLSGAKVVKFAHNDPADLERLLIAERSAARHALVATDGVFSMDGDIAPLDVLSDLCQRHDAWLLSDDAHGVGVLAGGRGSGALFPNAEIPLQMGTLSKALGSYGGYVCGSQAVIDLLKTRARTLVYATGLPPASAAAALAALDLIEADPVMTEIPVAKARLFTQRLALPEASSPIVPVILGSAESALAASARLEAQGFLVVAIRPPTVPEGMARLRIAFSAAHDDDDVIRLADAIVALLGGVS